MEPPNTRPTAQSLTSVNTCTYSWTNGAASASYCTSEVHDRVAGGLHRHRSPPHFRSLLDAVAESAARLRDSLDSSIFRVDGDMVRLVAHKGPIPEAGHATPPDAPLVRGTVNGGAIIERRTIQVGVGSTFTFTTPVRRILR